MIILNCCHKSLSLIRCNDVKLISKGGVRDSKRELADWMLFLIAFFAAFIMHYVMSLSPACQAAKRLRGACHSCYVVNVFRS